VWLIAHANYYG